MKDESVVFGSSSAFLLSGWIPDMFATQQVNGLVQTF